MGTKRARLQRGRASAGVYGYASAVAGDDGGASVAYIPAALPGCAPLCPALIAPSGGCFFADWWSTGVAWRGRASVAQRPG